MRSDMENIEIAKTLWRSFNDLDWDKATQLLSSDFMAEWPQSRERMIGPKNFIGVNQNYPGTHKIEVLRSMESGNLVITEVHIKRILGGHLSGPRVEIAMGTEILRLVKGA